MNEINDKNYKKYNYNKFIEDINNIDIIINYKINKDLSSIIKNSSISYFFYHKELYNEKGTKLKNIENYISLISIIEEYIKIKEEHIVLFFKKIKVNIMKVIINGFLTFDCKENYALIPIIKNLIPFFYNKNLFYFIYNKLSKIYRKFSFYENKELLFSKFSKLLDIWELLYKNYTSEFNLSFISLIRNNFFVLDIIRVEQSINVSIKSINITVEFFPFFNFTLNDNEYNFSFIKVYFSLLESKEITINDIKINKDQNIYKITFIITNNYYIYSINDDADFNNKENKQIFINDISLIEKIEILNNYIGKIINIKASVEYDDTIKEFQINGKGIQNESINKNYSILDNISLNFYINKENFICYRNSSEIFCEDIKYYGGMQNFVPLFKIIKYFIEEFSENSIKIKSLKEYIIKIINVINVNICYSEKNFINFKNILISLIGSLAEINHVLSDNHKKDLFNNQAFSVLYIIIVSSSFPISLKKSYEMITGLDDKNKLNLIFDEIIFDINELNYNYFQWYSIMLYIYIGFILLVLNDYNRIPKNILMQLIDLYEKAEIKRNKKQEINLFINILIRSLNYICDIKGEENLLKNYEKLDDLSEYLLENDNFNHYYLFQILTIIKAFLNIIDFNNISFQKNGETNNNSNNIINTNINIEIKDFIDISGKNNFKYNYKNLLDSFEDLFNYNNFIKIKESINNKLKDFTKHQLYLKKIFHFKNKSLFESESNIIIKEFIDYHREYHKLMKNIFMFNRFWSDKKLYFNEEKKKLLKYKYANYYTSNFQRPLVFPIYDYKNYYPNFTKFEIKDKFYLVEENKDNYNFSLDCPELDNFSIKYENELSKIIERNYLETIHIYKVCLIKRTHHVKGNLYIINKNGLIKKILFHSYPNGIGKDSYFCNVTKGLEHHNHKKEKLCFGEIFTCPQKDMNIKIFIDIANVRLILQRIYYYRKTAIEIFTNTKSYYFNFAEDFKSKKEKSGEYFCENVIKMMSYYYKTEFFPIKIKQNLMGYSREFGEIIKKYSDKNKKNDLMDLENKFMSVLFNHWKPNSTDIEFSTFDMIIYLNLLSNRSYMDLCQYPIFPLLFFYEKNEKNSETKIFERVLSEHIGFQEISEKSKIRKNIIINTYELLKECQENESFDESDKPIYFKTHYSNNVYTSNFLIRLFPYSFISIELQGSNFDSPDRLFFSIEQTFYNISYQKSDIRELIPEFYYFPEMFININKINFHERANGTKVDDVEMPNKINFLDKNIFNNDILEIKDHNYESSNYFKIFRFIEKMRNLLESKSTEINYWINIIFGPKQRYEDFKKKDQLFRDETYVDFSKDKEKEFEKYVQDQNIMTSVEFGITPVQTLFNEKEIINYKNRNSIYDNKVKNNKELYKELCKTIERSIERPNSDENYNNIIINKKRGFTHFAKNVKIMGRFQNKNDLNSINSINNINKKHQKVGDKNILKIEFNIEKLRIKGYNTGKVEIFIDGELYDELYDHSNEITCIDYNKRLNMFCTSSKDGFLYLYIYPNKLITALKNPNDNYFNKVFLSSNPFPCIIAYEENNYEIFSFSINGFKITKISLYILLDIKKKINNLNIISFFNCKGGTYKDRLIVILNNIKGNTFKCQLINIPFFDKEENTFEIKK